MDQPTRPQVLSYATPTSRRHVRKPLRTEIVTDPKLPYVHFIEVSAEEKVNAVQAIIFIAITVLLIGTMASREWLRTAGPRPGQALFLTIFCLLQIGTVLYVIQVVWTRTILSVHHGELWLEVQAPVGSHVRRWPPHEVLGIEAWTTDEGAVHLDALAELHVRPRNAVTLKLLRNYPRSELVSIAAAIERELRRTQLPQREKPP